MPKCESCGTEFEESKCQTGRQKYCSVKCRNISWRKINTNNMLEIKRGYHRTYAEKIRMRCLIHYGGLPPVCSCCGENKVEFLGIDHINGHGNEHRKSMKGTNIYRWLIKNDFPEGYQVLCHNCNLSKGFYGYCPHKNKNNNLNINYLDDMLTMQEDFQARWNMYPSLDKIASAMGAESIGELWKKSGGKWWSKKIYTHEERLDELVDILHFFLQYMIAEKVTSLELFNVYCKKLKENYKRQESGNY